MFANGKRQKDERGLERRLMFSCAPFPLIFFWGATACKQPRITFLRRTNREKKHKQRNAFHVVTIADTEKPNTLQVNLLIFELQLFLETSNTFFCFF